MNRSLGLILAALVLSACNTSVIPAPTKNLIPPNIPLDQVKPIILKSLQNSHKTQWDNPQSTGQMVAGEIFGALRGYTGWNSEKIEPGQIRASTLRRSKHYVAVNISYTESEWWLTIVEGKNIKFDGERIHEEALLWVQQLEHRIRLAFGTYQTTRELEEGA